MVSSRVQEKKWLPCLGVGCEAVLWTDRLHRFCPKCRKRNVGKREFRNQADSREGAVDRVEEASGEAI